MEVSEQPEINQSADKQSVRLGWLYSVLISIIILAGAGYAFYLAYLKNPCELPVKYSVGDVDARFKISKDDVIKAADDAARRWNDQTGDANLVYDPSSNLKINLIYDERQAEIDKMTKEVGDLNSTGNAIDSLRQKVEIMIAQYQKDFAAYDAEVSRWNSQGGAQADTYTRLQSEREALEARRNSINNTTEVLNQQINDQNTNIDQINSQIDANKNKIITQGLYYPAEVKIDIFTFGNAEELRLAVMHELGHALSLDHNKITQSIMYPILGDQDLTNPTLSDEDKVLFTETCKSPLSALKKMFQGLKNFSGTASNPMS